MSSCAALAGGAAAYPYALLPLIEIAPAAVAAPPAPVPPPRFEI